jgi:hypothetical protein
MNQTNKTAESSKMSAPYPGRQSPEPETQSGAQQRDPPSTGKLGSSLYRAPEFSYERGDPKAGAGLESNPTQRYEEVEAAKYKK